MKLGTVFIRIVMVSFWVAIFFLFLFAPKVKRLLFEEKNLHIFTWPLLLDAQKLSEFEKKTGIKLYISYYESNEELFSKLRATKGRGYDIVIPSDYTIALLIKEGFLKKIDYSKLNFIDHIDPKLLHNYYDPQSDYSIPYFWGVYGLGIDKSFFGGVVPEATWGLIFDKDLAPSSISMTDVPREALLIAAKYLFGSIDNLDDNHLFQIELLLKQQKQWVRVYTDARAEELLVSKSCPVIVALSPDVWKVKRYDDTIDFIIPREGSFLVIDALVIPQATKKDALIYQFINYLYQPDVIEHHLQKYGLCPPTTNVTSEVESQFCPTSKQFKALDFFRNVVPEKKLNDLWINVMGN